MNEDPLSPQTTTVSSSPAPAAPEPAPTTPSEGTGETAQVADSTPSSEGTVSEARTTSNEAESFTDINDMPDELQAHYKRMQRDYTKKMQEIAAGRQKIQAYDAFAANPTQAVRQLASQYGLTVQEAQAAVNQAAAEQASTPWEPADWQDVITKAKTETRQELLSELQPVFDELRGIKRTSIETQLDEAVPEWREYETEMSATLAAHPTLANDPVKLAKLALPEEYFESKATQAALKRLERKQSSARVSGGSAAQTMPQPGDDQVRTFADAVAFAKAQLQGQGR